jgi:general secretion pathway protein J
LQLAWQKAAQWAQSPTEDDRQREVRIAGLDQWQIFYYRGDAWSNPLSSAGTAVDAKPAVEAPTPDAIRLVLTLAPGQALTGSITRDWLRPTVGGGK